jgi:nucleotide-binding universal stress UspA family protein
MIANARLKRVFGDSASEARWINRILLATDFSAASGAATSQAIELAAQLGADVIAVSVIEPRALRLPGGRPALRVDQVRAAREEAAQDLVADGRAVGVRIEFLVWVGEPGDRIVEAAQAEAADMIVVGSHGRGSVGRFLIGSVSDHVVRHATCPVMVVRGAAAESAEGGYVQTPTEGDR